MPCYAPVSHGLSNSGFAGIFISMVYLDHNATMAMAPAVREAMLPGLARERACQPPPPLQKNRRCARGGGMFAIRLGKKPAS